MVRILKLTVLVLVVLSCGRNEPNEKSELSKLDSRMELYCSLSKNLYNQYEMTIEPKCDAALFTSLHGLACDYVTITQFESRDTPGKLCRRPGCTCFDNWQEGIPGSDSGFSKDMALGMQTYGAFRPDRELASRVVTYGEANNWFVCEADNYVTEVSKCAMSPKISQRWHDLAGRASKNLRMAATDFEAHLQIVSIIAEYGLNCSISDYSLSRIKYHSDREPNNLLYQAMKGRFLEASYKTVVANRLLDKFGPKLPTTNDWCESYLFQRDEYKADGKRNPDWLPCSGNKVHPGTDFLVASWVLNKMQCRG